MVLKQQGERLLQLENEMVEYEKHTQTLAGRIENCVDKQRELEDRVLANDTNLDLQLRKLVELEEDLDAATRLKFKIAEKAAVREGWGVRRSLQPNNTTVPGGHLDTPVTTLLLPTYRELCHSLLEWRSPCMYTHSGGYKICLKVKAHKDSGIGKKSLVISLIAMPGEFDKRLKWPARARFIFEILNQEGQGDLVFVSACNSWIQPVEECCLQFSNLKNMENSGTVVDCHRLSGFVRDNSLEFRLTKLPELS